MTTMSAARVPVYARVINASAATFSPTCFMAVNARTLLMAAPAATSSATISLVEYSMYTPASLAISDVVSAISEAGVPGYVVITPMPVSSMPRVMASLPKSKTRFPKVLSSSLFLRSGRCGSSSKD